MNIIATNKVLEYIERHPEARIPLLIWLKGNPYWSMRNDFLDHDGNPSTGCGSAGSSIGEYSMNYIVNYDARTYLITWLGNEEERKVERERQMKEDLEKYPNMVVMPVTETVVVEVTLPLPPQRPPAPISEPEKVSFTFKTIEGGTTTIPSIKKDPGYCELMIS